MSDIQSHDTLPEELSTALSSKNKVESSGVAPILNSKNNNQNGQSTSFNKRFGCGYFLLCLFFGLIAIIGLILGSLSTFGDGASGNSSELSQISFLMFIVGVLGAFSFLIFAFKSIENFKKSN